MEQHPIPIKKPVSNKQPSLFSSTRKIQKKQKRRYAHTSAQCGPIFHIFELPWLWVVNRGNSYVSHWQ